MIPICDYHIHTSLCGHAVGQPVDYVKKALGLGLKQIGFSDHAPLLSHRDPGITMDMEELPIYHQFVEKLQKQFEKQIDVKIGIEADFDARYKKELQVLLKKYPYDYVIGSVHFIKGWAFDDPSEISGWVNTDTNEIYRNYYESLRESAQSGLFDIMAHVDLVKKFGHRPSVDMTDEIATTAEAFKKAGVVVEVNTSGLRKPVKEIYPDETSLGIYRQFGVPITFGSDAHDPEDVGRDFDKAVQSAKTAGYREYTIFKKRKIEGFIRFGKG